MSCFKNRLQIIVALTLAASGPSSLEAQTAALAAAPAAEEVVHLVVPEGAPLRVILTEKTPFKSGQPVRGRVVDPVYAFDREVIPSGSEVLGHIAGFKPAPRFKRTWAMFEGNFTPLRDPQLLFDTLVLRDGKAIPIDTLVTPGANKTVRVNTGTGEKKKGPLALATEAARQQIDEKKRAVIAAIKAPGKLEKVKHALWSFSPWQPQYLKSASRFNARLKSSLDFGEVSIPPSELGELGAAPAPDAIVAARLIPSLKSSTAVHGATVEAVLTRPLFSADNHLLFPEGSRLVGDIVQAEPARLWHHNGKLAFMFTHMELPAALSVPHPDVPAVQEVEGRLDGVEFDDADGMVKIDEEGGAAVASSRKRFLMPAITTVLALNGAEAREPVKVNHVPTGAYRNRLGGRLISGGIGLGLLGSVVGRFAPPAAPALGFYGAGRSVYSNLVARGENVIFPADTPIEIRLSGTGPEQK